MRFSSSCFFHQSTPFWLLFHLPHFLNFVSNSSSYLNSKFVLRYGSMRVTNFFCRYQRLINLGGTGPGYYCFYTYFFLPHSPFQGYGKLLNNCCALLHCGIGLALWPIAHSQTLRYGPQHMTKYCATAHSA
jgi:hypothetical protein